MFKPSQRIIFTLTDYKDSRNTALTSAQFQTLLETDVPPDGFKVSAVDYFLYLNKEHNIMGEVIASSEFKQFMKQELTKQIKKEIIE